jgi:hypothetical protein
MGFGLAILLSAVPLRNWASGIKTDEIRGAALRIVDPFASLSARLRLDVPYRAMREGFLSLIEKKEPDQSGRIPETAAAPQPSAATIPEVRYSPSHPLTVLLIGDSLAWNHIPAQFSESIKNRPEIAFTRISKISSTLSDPAIFDWIAEIGKIFAEKERKDSLPYNLIIVTMGANDAQAIYTPEEKLPFQSAGWIREFLSRVSSFRDILTANCGKIYWLGIPPMRKEGYKDRMVFVNSLYEAGVARYPSIVYVPVDHIIGDEHGLFTQTKIIGGRQEMIRSKDGIHYDYPGAQLIVDTIMRLMEKDFFTIRKTR